MLKLQTPVHRNLLWLKHSAASSLAWMIFPQPARRSWHVAVPDQGTPDVHAFEMHADQPGKPPRLIRVRHIVYECGPWSNCPLGVDCPQALTQQVQQQLLPCLALHDSCFGETCSWQPGCNMIAGRISVPWACLSHSALQRLARIGECLPNIGLYISWTAIC